MFIFLLDPNLEKTSGSAPSIPRDVLGSSWVSKEAKFIKDFDYLGFSRCFSIVISLTGEK